MIAYLVNYYANISRALFGHVEILLLTLFFAIPISALVTCLIYRHRVLIAPALVVLEIFYAVPSLAFFAVLIPFTGLGTGTAVIVLVSYSLFFLVRNFLGGLEDIDPLLKEAGMAMGCSPFEVFRKIELPLAMPAFIAGVRMASVSTIGIACVAYAIGAGGIGTILFEGMRQLLYVKIIWGAILAILLSVAVNNALLALERYFARRADPGAQARGGGEPA
jgi:osmoprotectant transport system permease protein